MRKLELLAPCGDMNKLKTALHFGADAVYVGGNNYGLRASAKNFTNEELKSAVEYVHSFGKSLYVTCNIVAHNSDFEGLKEYFDYLESIAVDAVIISDLGVLEIAKTALHNTKIHVSTQANLTNKYACKHWAECGASRIVLARELSITEIAEIKEYIGESVELECFVHGAMCISHSGRCLLSNFLSKRDGNRGACVQACRWEYTLHEKSRPNSPLTMEEDEHGTYIMNSKDLNMLEYLDKLIEAGVTSFKIEGRMKSQYYVGTVVNAYRQAIDSYLAGAFNVDDVKDELVKTSHREYTTGFYFGEYDSVNLVTSQATCDYDFIAEVIGYDDTRNALLVEQRNRFVIGDKLEILSTNKAFNTDILTIERMTDEFDRPVDDAKLVQQKLYIYTDKRLEERDILRKRSNG